MALDPNQLATLQHARETSLSRLLLLSRRSVMHRIRQLSAESQLPRIPPAYAALLPYIDLSGTRPSKMAERAEISKQAAGKAIDTLEKLGLVKRVHDRKDGRASVIHFTDAGIACLLAIHEAIDEMERDVEREVGRDAFNKLKGYLRRIATKWEDT
jgi:DNA-binding MarR family transcriptional regulator